MELVLHAGMHKTGTSSFQAILRSVHQGQSQKAWVLPSAFNAKNNKRFDPEWIHDNLSKAKANNTNRLIVSHEGLSTLSTNQWKSIKDAIPSTIDTKIILVFRHWKTFLESRWATYSLRRDGTSFHRYIEDLVANSDSRYEMNQSLCITMPYNAGFRNIKCIDYDNQLKREHSILPALLKETGIRCETAQKVNKNTRPDKNIIEIIRIMNAARSSWEKRKNNDLYLSFGEYRPCDCFYDHMKLLQELKIESPQIIDELEQAIQASIVDIDIRALSKAIHIQEKVREDKMRPWIDNKNGCTSMAIGLNCPKGLYSKIEFEELGDTLKNKLISKITDKIGV